jgi:large repetitive protein
MTTTVNTINGNEGNNRLTGGSGNDVINGNGGNDRLNGGSGADILNGGAGKDELNGGSGNDVLDGGSGSDELEGGSGNDRFIYTLAENNVIGKTTYDEYEGGSGSDTLELRFTRAEWMNINNQTVLQNYINWANKSGSGCRWDDDFTFRFSNARLEIEDIEKLVVKVDDKIINNVGKKKNVDAVNDIPNSITDDETGVQSIYVLTNDSVDNLVKNLELVSSTTKGTLELVKPESTKDNANTWYFEYTPDSTVYQSLNAGEFREETFTYRVTDADGDQDTAEVKITITGINDAAIITGAISGLVIESGSDNLGGFAIRAGQLFSSISNNGNPFKPITSQITTYGEFSITSQGNWIYKLDNEKIAVNELNEGSPGKDSITVYAADNTEQIITINIDGANDAAVIGDPPINQVKEDTNSPGYSGIFLSENLSISDVDNPSAFISGFALSQNTKGSLYVFENGQYIYQVENSNIQFLGQGKQLIETFTVTAVDGTSKDISFTIIGVNDVAEIAGEVTGIVTESGISNDGGSSTTTGQLTINDIDNFESSFKAEENKTTTYGKFSITSEGVWTYTLDNENEIVNSLNSISTDLKDTFTIKSIDGTPQTITIKINGANDAAMIGGTTSGSVIEKGSNNGEGSPQATGLLTASDVDNLVTFKVVNGQESISKYGTYSIAATGEWIYELNNNNDKVNALNIGGTLTDSFKIYSADNTELTIEITINGANDAAIIGDPLINELMEDANNAPRFEPIFLGGYLSISDVDNSPYFITGFAPSQNTIGYLYVWGGGQYIYQVENSEIQYLSEGQELTETFTVRAEDGTQKPISFTITGVNDAAVIGDLNNNQVTEDAGNIVDGFITLTGGITIADADNGESFFQPDVIALFTNKGSLDLNSDGSYTYKVSNADIQPLNASDRSNDVFTIFAKDGTEKTIFITINGVDDAAIISGEKVGVVLENGRDNNSGTPNVLGQLSSSNANNGKSFKSVEVQSTTYGEFSITSQGLWIYKLNNNNNEVNALNVDGTLTDSFTIYSSDNTEQIITIYINGANDTAMIDGTISGSVIEKGISNGDGSPNGTGSLTASDVDNVPNTFQLVTGQESISKYGTYSITADGKWTYLLNNDNETVNKLNSNSEALKDTFTIYSIDGTPQEIKITINGADDVVNSAPVVKELGQGENKYAGSANVRELINLDHFKSSTPVNTEEQYKAKYDFDHVRTGHFSFSDSNLTDTFAITSKAAGPEGNLGTLNFDYAKAKDSGGNIIDGEYIVKWTYTVKDSDLDSLNASAAGSSSKDDDFIVTIDDGTAKINTKIMLNLFGRDEIKFTNMSNENSVLNRTDASESATLIPGNSILYMGAGNDSALASSGSDVIYGESGNDNLTLYEEDSVIFGGIGNDNINHIRSIKSGLLFGENGSDTIIFNTFISSNILAADQQKIYAWGGEGADEFQKKISTTKQTGNWVMDFDSRKPLEGGDKINYFESIVSSSVGHIWSQAKTQLVLHAADDSHLFLSEGEKYYELKVQSSIFLNDPNWYSVLNLVGTNGAEITLDGLFANGNLPSLI